MKTDKDAIDSVASVNALKIRSPWLWQLISSSRLKPLVAYVLELFDFEFREIMTVKMLPLLYGVAILSIATTTIYLGIHAALVSIPLGLIYGFFIAPIFFIFCVSAARTTLEFFSALFTVQAHMQQMNTTMQQMCEHIKNMNERTDGIEAHTLVVANTLNELNLVTDKIPFLKKNKKAEKIDRDQAWAQAPLKAQIDSSFTPAEPDEKPIT